MGFLNPKYPPSGESEGAVQLGRDLITIYLHKSSFNLIAVLERLKVIPKAFFSLKDRVKVHCGNRRNSHQFGDLKTVSNSVTVLPIFVEHF